MAFTWNGDIRSTLSSPCRLLYSFSKFKNDLDCLTLKKKLTKKVDLLNFSSLMLAQGELRADRHDIGVFVHFGVVGGGELDVI